MWLKRASIHQQFDVTQNYAKHSFVDRPFFQNDRKDALALCGEKFHSMLRWEAKKVLFFFFGSSCCHRFRGTPLPPLSLKRWPVYLCAPQIVARSSRTNRRRETRTVPNKRRIVRPACGQRLRYRWTWTRSRLTGSSAIRTNWVSPSVVWSGSG